MRKGIIFASDSFGGLSGTGDIKMNGVERKKKVAGKVEFRHNLSTKDRSKHIVKTFKEFYTKV